MKATTTYRNGIIGLNYLYGSFSRTWSNSSAPIPILSSNSTCTSEMRAHPFPKASPYQIKQSTKLSPNSKNNSLKHLLHQRKRKNNQRKKTKLKNHKLKKNFFKCPHQPQNNKKINLNKAIAIFLKAQEVANVKNCNKSRYLTSLKTSLRLKSYSCFILYLHICKQAPNKTSSNCLNSTRWAC